MAGVSSRLVLAMMLIICYGTAAAAGGTWPGSTASVYDAMYAGSGGASARTRAYYAGDMAGESVRRVLDDTTSTYISYAALSANSVPCSTAGVSYYDCASSGAANPYTRSCTTITLCARDTS